VTGQIIVENATRELHLIFADHVVLVETVVVDDHGDDVV
jgi:hypothetical protein